MNKYSKLSSLLEEFTDIESGRPETCYCHHNPPCGHCCYEPSNEIQTTIDEFISDWENKE